MVARRYWPHGTSDAAIAAMRLATHLSQNGVKLRVLTPKIRGGGQSAVLTHRAIKVHRLGATPRSQWTAGRYIRQWTASIVQHCQDVDAILCVGARDEAAAAVDAGVSMNLPTVVWPTMTIAESDIAHWRNHSSIRRYVGTFRKSAALIANDSVDRRMLVAEGIDQQRIETTATLWPTRVQDHVHVDLNRTDARRTLANVNTDLHADQDQVVVMTTAAMVRGGPIESFCKSLLPVSAVYPRAKFWMIGDGPARGRLYNQIRGDGLRSIIAMPGTFNFAADVCAAADIFLHIDPQPWAGWWLDAIVAGMHQIVRKTDRNETFFQSIPPSMRPPVTWCDNDPVSIKSAIKQTIESIGSDPAALNRTTDSARRHRAESVESGGRRSWAQTLQQIAAGATR